MNKPRRAFLLNFAIPGAGLLYLGKPLWGILNFAVVTLVGLSIALLSPQFFNEFIHYIIVAFAAGSGGFAHAAAQRPERECGDGIR